MLAWLAERVREPRFRLAALAWLALALVHSLAVDAPLSALFRESAHPASGVPSLLALAAAAAWTGWLRAELRARARQGLGRVPGQRHAPRPPADAARARRGREPARDRGRVADAARARPELGLGPRRGDRPLGRDRDRPDVAGQRLAGLTWAGATVALAVLYDVNSLSGDARWGSLARRRGDGARSPRCSTSAS